MGNNKHRKRPQAQKINRHANPEFAAAMREIGRSSATDRHRVRNREDRQDWRKQRQRGEW